MTEIHFQVDNKKILKKAYLVGVSIPGSEAHLAAEHLQELEELVSTLGFQTAKSVLVYLKKPNAKFYIGSGKVKEIALSAKENGAECIIVDFELSPSQQRNWETVCGLYVIDRQEVILDIFASRAKTREAVIQVSLAKMEYSLPRLTRAWTHLSRQRGGALGTRGEGETQLEADRRMVQNRITQFKKELIEVSKHRKIQRAKREKSTIPLAAIVGYTNVGKSSLLNALSGASVFVENKLFATLDPTTKAISLSENQPLLITDTVGFIRKLPHTLVEAFKSTLEEVAVADFLIHVLDISSPSVEQHFKTTLSLLKDLKSQNKPAIIVFNKIDKLENPVVKARIKALYPDSTFISAKTGEGLDLLLQKLRKIVDKDSQTMHFKIPSEKSKFISKIYRLGKVIGIKYEGNSVLISVRMPKIHKNIFSEYLI